MPVLDWSKLPPLTTLRAFEAAASGRSFSAAARSLNVTPAAVAQQVNSLEKHLGFALVQRSPRGISLTIQGEKLATSLRNGFTTIVEGVEAVLEQENSRPIRVTTTSYFTETVIFPRIAEFWRDNPRVELSFTPCDEPVDVVRDGFDVAVRAGDGEWKGLRATLLLNSPTIACAAPHLVDDPRTDWLNVPWLIPGNSLWERDALSQSGICVEGSRTHDVGNPSLEIKAAEEGLGLTLESEIDLRTRIERGSLKIAPITISHVSSYYLVTPPWPQRPAVTEFVAWLRRICRDID